MQLLMIFGMLAAVCSVLFALQNNVPVTITFLHWHIESSLALVLLLAIVAGGFIVALVSTPATLRKQWTLSRQKKNIAELETVIAEQKERIQVLEQQGASGESGPQETASYIGLKQIIAGKDGTGGKPDA